MGKKKKKSSLPLIIEQFFKVTLCAKGWSKSVRDSKGVLILFIWSRSVCIKKKKFSHEVQSPLIFLLYIEALEQYKPRYVFSDQVKM